MTRTPGPRWIVALLVAALTFAACGGDTTTTASPSPTEEAGEAFPVTVEAENGSVEVVERPERIVSMSATATEMLFAIGAGDQVVAVDDQSNHPTDAPTTDLSAFTPNVEAITTYEPDLVVISDDIEGLLDSLGEIGITVLHEPAAQTLDDTYDQITDLARATGHADEGDELVSEMRAELSALAAEVPAFDEPPTYYHELDQNLYTVTSQTFIGQLYSEFAGLESIADAAGADTPYPQLSAEAIVEGDPDLIFLADTKCCGQSAETVAERPGWSGITAVQEGNIVELDDDVASRWGPRVVDLLRRIVKAVSELEA